MEYCVHVILWERKPEKIRTSEREFFTYEICSKSNVKLFNLESPIVNIFLDYVGTPV